MSPDDLIMELGKYIPQHLAEDVVNNFIALKSDTAVALLERSSPGKFVETVVQILQFELRT